MAPNQVPHFQWLNETLLIRCHIQPKASNNEFSGLFNARLKIRITAPATDGKANKAVIVFLSQEFGVAKSQVEITKGENSRDKTVKISNPVRVPTDSQVKPPDP